MSTKITPVQLNANTKIYGVDDYREMVNYTSGTNKGYVRFTKASDGKLKLEKFNNKIDVPLSLRSNTSAVHNKAVREKFLSAMKHDLMYMDEPGKKKIEDMIIRPLKPDASGINAGKALSRRDVKAVLDEFDKIFNTTRGRQRILDNFFNAAMKSCGFTGDLATFKRDFMKLDANGLDDVALDEYSRSVDGKGSERDRMVKKEMEFRTVIGRLEGLLDAAMQRVKVDRSIKDLARAALNKGDAFGLDIANQGGGRLLSDIRASLTNLLKLRGVKSDGAVLDVFLGKVLPFYLQDGVSNVRDYLGGDKEEAIDANFDFEALVAMAEEFVKGADEAAKNPAAVKALDSEDYGVLQDTMENFADTRENVDINGVVAQTAVTHAKVTASYARRLTGQIISMKELFRADAALDNFAARFVMKRFARGAENMIQKDATMTDEVKDFVQTKLVPALRLQFGERWAVGGHYVETGGASEFIDALADHAKSFVDTLGGGRTLYEKLFSYTLPNIINQRIDNAVLGQDRMHFEGGDDGGRSVAMKQITRTALAYLDFCRKKAAALTIKAEDGFRKILERQRRKGNITAEESAIFLADFSTKIKEALERAINRFFEESPAPVKTDDFSKDAKEGVQRLVQLFQEEKGNVISELSRNLVTTVLAHSVGGSGEGVRARRNLLDSSKAVEEFMGAIPGRNPPLDPQLAGPALRRGLERLYWKTVDEMLKDRKVEKKPVDEKFVDAVRGEFAKRAARFVEKAEKYGRKLDETLRRMVTDIVNEQIDGEGVQVLRDHAGLGKDERKTLVNSLVDDVMLSEKNRVGALKERFLLDPEVYGEVSAKDAVEREFEVDYSMQDLTRTMLRAAKERIFAVSAWLEARDGQGRTFAENLLEGETQRLRQANPDVPAAEIANIAKEQTDAILKRVRDFVLLYSVGGRDGFAARVNRDLATASDARMKAYSAFRGEFLKLAQASLDKCSSLGREKLDATLATFLDEASRRNPPPDAKVMARAFDKKLTDIVNGIVDRKFDQYLSYSRMYTEAFENANPVLGARVEARVAELKEVGATDADIQFFREKIVPRLRERMEFEIGEKPEEWLGQDGRDKAAKIFDDAFVAIKRDIGFVRLDPLDEKGFEDGLRLMLDMLGFSGFMDDESTKAAVKANVVTWLKSESVQQLMADMRRAMMTLRVYDRGSQAEPAKAAKNTVDRFYAELRAAVAGIQGQILMEGFNNTQLEPALKLFDLWLEQYDLPKTEIQSGGETVTLKDLARRHFIDRVRVLQARIASEGAVSEPLLSQEYLKSFLQFINANGTRLMLLEMKDKVKAREMERMIATSAEIFDVETAMTNGEPPNVITAMAVNKAGLNTLLDLNMEIVEKEMLADTPTVESLQRWRKDIEERFANHMRNTNSFRMSCESRVRQMRQLDGIEVKAKTFLEMAVRERFGGVDILNGESLPDKLVNNNDFASFVSNLTNNLMKQVMDKAESLRRTAHEAVSNPLESQTVFTTDTPDGAALGGEFRELARQCVKAACDTKVYRGLVKMIDRELRIK